jgi:hypothetical protein
VPNGPVTLSYGRRFWFDIVAITYRKATLTLLCVHMYYLLKQSGLSGKKLAYTAVFNAYVAWMTVSMGYRCWQSSMHYFICPQRS